MALVLRRFAHCPKSAMVAASSYPECQETETSSQLISFFDEPFILRNTFGIQNKPSHNRTAIMPSIGASRCCRRHCRGISTARTSLPQHNCVVIYLPTVEGVMEAIATWAGTEHIVFVIFSNPPHCMVSNSTQSTHLDVYQAVFPCLDLLYIPNRPCRPWSRTPGVSCLLVQRYVY